MYSCAGLQYAVYAVVTNWRIDSMLKLAKLGKNMPIERDQDNFDGALYNEHSDTTLWNATNSDAMGTYSEHEIIFYEL